MHRLFFQHFLNIFNTQQSFATENTRYLCNGATQIFQIYRKFLKHTPAQNKKKLFPNFEGETPPNNKMNVENLKNDQTIWIFKI